MNILSCGKELSRFVLLIALIFCTSILANSATFTVTTKADSGPGSLRAAVMAANTNNQTDTITFNIPTDNVDCTVSVCTITLTSGELVILNDGGNTITIDGSGMNRIRISGNNTSRVFIVDPALGTSAGLSLINLTITGGNGVGTPGYDNIGGGLFNNGGTVSLNRVTVSGNTGTLAGGGLYNYLGAMTITNSTISGNNSSSGGGIQQQSTIALTLNNTTITKNSASAVGLLTPPQAGGVRIFSGTVNAKNTIIADNINSVNPDVSGAFTSQGYNLIGNTTGSTGFSVLSNDILNPVSGVLLDVLSNNGGQSNTHALLQGSPAIDTANSNSFLLIDQRGASRPLDGDLNGSALPDIGSFEAGAKIVTKTADTNDGICNADCSLREAITEANNSTANDSIIFSSLFNSPQTVTLSGSELNILNSGSLTINAPNINLLTITGNNRSRVINISSQADVKISGLIISNGNGAGALESGFGGGIRNAGSLSLTNTNIKNNSTNFAGGGIYQSVGSNLEIINSILNFNSAKNGGAIYSLSNSSPSNAGVINISNSTINNNTAGSDGGGIYYSFHTLNLTNSTISNNNALNRSGGGIFNYFGTLNLNNSTINGNTAHYDGGGLLCDNATTSIINSTINNNRTSSIGGGLFINNGIVNLLNSIIAGNFANATSPDVYGTLNSRGYNLIENTQGTNIVGITTGNILGQDPQLLPLGNYGGVTQTVALLPTSPAIDREIPAVFPKQISALWCVHKTVILMVHHYPTLAHTREK